MNFIKLKNQFVFNEEDILPKEELLSIGSGALKNFSVDSNNPIIEKVYNVIPNYARSLFSVSIVQISTLLAPHVDDVNTSILFYLIADGNKTQFYNVINSNPDIYYSSTELNGKTITDENYYKPVTYKMEDLIEDEFYIANSYEAYVVDGSKPHAVVSTVESNNVYRSFILLKTNLAFSTVKSILEKTDSI